MDRRRFFKRLSLGLFIPLGFLSWKSISENKKRHANSIVEISDEIVSSNQFYNGIIIYKSGDFVRFYSDECSHLGCHINKVDQNGFICPCHGSKYSFDGKVISGPAQNDLKSLYFEYFEDEKKYVVHKLS